MSPVVRNVALALGVLLVFGIAVVVLLRVIPPPHKDTDYLVIGGVATLLSMVALFVGLITTTFRASDNFFKKRKRE